MVSYETTIVEGPRDGPKDVVSSPTKNLWFLELVFNMNGGMDGDFM